MKYRVFIKPGCSVCKAVVKNLKARGVSFEEVDVSKSDGWNEAVRLKISAAGTVVDESNNIIPLEEVV